MMLLAAGVVAAQDAPILPPVNRPPAPPASLTAPAAETPAPAPAPAPTVAAPRDLAGRAFRLASHAGEARAGDVALLAKALEAWGARAEVVPVDAAGGDDLVAVHFAEFPRIGAGRKREVVPSLLLAHASTGALARLPLAPGEGLAVARPGHLDDTPSARALLGFVEALGQPPAAAPGGWSLAAPADAPALLAALASEGLPASPDGAPLPPRLAGGLDGPEAPLILQQRLRAAVLELYALDGDWEVLVDRERRRAEIRRRTE